MVTADSLHFTLTVLPGPGEECPKPWFAGALLYWGAAGGEGVRQTAVAAQALPGPSQHLQGLGRED